MFAWCCAGASRVWSLLRRRRRYDRIDTDNCTTITERIARNTPKPRMKQRAQTTLNRCRIQIARIACQQRIARDHRKSFWLVRVIITPPVPFSSIRSIGRARATAAMRSTHIRIVTIGHGLRISVSICAHVDRREHFSPICHTRRRHRDQSIASANHISGT